MTAASYVVGFCSSDVGSELGHDIEYWNRALRVLDVACLRSGAYVGSNHWGFFNLPLSADANLATLFRLHSASLKIEGEGLDEIGSFQCLAQLF